MIKKPHSAACERNRDPILAVLREHFADRKQVLEIGSGTGQHAVYFAAALPHLVWQTSDRKENHEGIQAWLDEAELKNALPPLALDVNENWPQIKFDAVFSANTLHIMSWAEVGKLFAHLDAVLAADAKLVIYGPFNYDGTFTSQSNAQFQQTLKGWGAHMGIRYFIAVWRVFAGMDCGYSCRNGRRRRGGASGGRRSRCGCGGRWCSWSCWTRWSCRCRRWRRCRRGSGRCSRCCRTRCRRGRRRTSSSAGRATAPRRRVGFFQRVPHFLRKAIDQSF